MEDIAGPWDSFTAHLPITPNTPVVVSVPHAGTSTRGFEDALASNLDVRCDADLWVDELYEGSPAGAFIKANLSRFVCDLNRHPDDVSAHAVPEHPAPRNSHGRGFIWEITTEGKAAMARPLSLQEWKRRQEIHAAYYGALATALDRARSKFGFAVLVDGHSMPSRGKAAHTDPGTERAAIVPGDRQGKTCAAALSRLVQDHFLQSGYGVKFNDPYQGGFITTHHGHPHEQVHAIQIEMRRDLYMNELTFEKQAAGFDRLRFSLEALLRTLDQFDPRS
ncbi:MAG: N-formylglutamate amidohydrolase [Deltaproteobacteria bacterium]|nr:N-formylglutamate amidohydrolase [Deltaproteobacteria bacterium]